MRRPPSDRRRRRRRLRLLRTILATLGVVVLIVVVATTSGGPHRAARTTAGSTSTSTTGNGAGTTTPPTTAAPPTALAVAHLPAVLPQAVSRASVVLDRGRLLVLGGLHGRSPGTSTAQVLSVDPTSGATVVAAPLEVATHDAAAAVLGSTVLLFGGGAGSTIADVQSWTPTATRTVGHLPQPRSDIVAATVDGHAYVMGGFDGALPAPEVLETDDGVSFHPVASLPVPVRYPAVAVLGSVIYLVGGQSITGAGGAGPPVTAIQAIDVANGTATVVGHLTSALTEAAAFAVRGTIFVAGGIRSGVTQAGVFRLDPVTGTLTPIATLPEPRADAGVGQDGDATYLIGGEGPSRLSSVVELRPA